MGELLRAKLLTEGGDLLSLGKTKILVSKLRLASPGRQELKGKKLITE